MHKRTEGIVLRTYPLGEADLIVTYLTPARGILKAFAKSPRKIKSRFGGSLEPLTHADIAVMGRENARLPRLTQSDIINSHQGLREELQCFTRMTRILELTLSLVHEGEPSDAAFALLSDTLATMEADGCTDLNALIYRIRLLSLAGFGPRLSGCGKCGAEGLGFYVTHGSVLCAECSTAHQHPERGYVRLSQGAVKLYETLLNWDLPKLARVKASPAMIAELDGMLETHIEHTLARELRAKGGATGLPNSPTAPSSKR